MRACPYFWFRYKSSCLLFFSFHIYVIFMLAKCLFDCVPDNTPCTVVTWLKTFCSLGSLFQHIGIENNMTILFNLSKLYQYRKKYGPF